jgi:Ni,Fe-hydrogenase I small subunit
MQLRDKRRGAYGRGLPAPGGKKGIATALTTGLTTSLDENIVMMHSEQKTHASVWLEYLRGTGCIEAIDYLIEEGQIATNELILAELLPPVPLAFYQP